MENRYKDAYIAMRDYGWKMDWHGGRGILIPPASDERSKWATMWDEEGIPHTLPKYSQGEE